MTNISLLNRLSSLEDIDFAQYKYENYMPSPEDWRDVVIYQLVTDRFNNPDKLPNYPWNSQEGRFQGGSFKGIEEKLEYLKNLGVNAIWMSPVQQNCQYLDFVSHGYSIQDFLKIDPRFCLNSNDPEDELKHLINAIHAKGMYVIFDIVLNHGGDVFEYNKIGSTANWSDSKYSILWRDEHGNGIWDTPPEIKGLHPYAGVGPGELFFNDAWRRQGKGDRFSASGEPMGDFESLKEMATDYSCVNDYGQVVFTIENILINVHKYLIAEFDVDGYRIDTLKYINRNFSKKFGNAMREFAMDIGKKNFFTYGEVWEDKEDVILSFVGRKPDEEADIVGVDSALDFPLRYQLVPVTKGYLAPIELVNFYKARKTYQKAVLSSHGEASRYFVTFLDNHDINERYLYSDEYQEQLILALTCQFTLQGIPCIYYGTEQGLKGRGNRPENVREALWGKENAFDETDYLYKCIAKLNQIRAKLAELRYGRLYFREISGDTKNFGYSCYSPGIIAFSRILSNKETVIVANSHTTNDFRGSVLIDSSLNSVNDVYEIVYSNKSDIKETKNVKEIINANISGNFSNIVTLEIDLKPMEVQILTKNS